MFGAIDGYSRLAASLECVFKAAMILPCFQNVFVADFMIEKRSASWGSIISDPSTHNQRIKHLWRESLMVSLAFIINCFLSRKTVRY